MPKAKLLDLDAMLPYEPAWAILRKSDGSVLGTFTDRTEAERYVQLVNSTAVGVGQVRIIKTMLAIES